MLKCWILFFRQKSASVSIEFAIIFSYLLVIFLIVIEFSRVIIISSALELVTTEITRKTAITEQNRYSEDINNFIKSEVPLWPYITDPSDFHVTIAYCRNVKDIINNNCQNSLNDETRILSFSLEYSYSTVFSDLFSFLNTALKRKVIVYREFSKSKQ